MAENDPITSPNEPKVKCKFDEMVDTSALTPHPKNPNKHSKDQIKRLAQILKYQGFRHTIIVSNFSGFIVVGHGRLEAAKLNGWEQVPIERQNFDDEAAEYAFMISDNAIGEWAELDLARINNDFVDLGPDFDVDLLGIKDFSIEPFDKYDNELEDKVPEEPKEAKTNLGELWILGNHRLLCGSCLEPNDIQKLMNDQIAEFCFTSPPYADMRTYEGGKDLSVESLSKFLFFGKDYCNLWAVNLGMKRKDNEVDTYWNEYLKIAKESDMKFLSWNIWDRAGEGVSIAQATSMFMTDHEWIFVFGNHKNINRTVENKTAGKANKVSYRNADGSFSKKRNYTIKSHKQLSTILKCRKERMGIHPAMFPVELPEEYIKACSNINNIIYEPFGGSGTTLIACQKTGRKCFTMELEPKYIDVVLSRWSEYTGEDPIREDGIKWSELNTGT